MPNNDKILFEDELYMLVYDLKKELFMRNRNNNDDLIVNKVNTPKCVMEGKGLIALSKMVYKCKELLHKKKLSLKEKMFLIANKKYINDYEEYITIADTQVLYEVLFRITKSKDKNGTIIKYFDDDLDTLIPSGGIKDIINRFGSDDDIINNERKLG